MPLDRILEAAMDPIRMRILALCEKQPRSVAELAAALDLSSERVQHHVGVLVDAELLREAEGRYRAVGLFEAFADEPERAKPTRAVLSDEAWQLAVLTRVLALHPDRLSSEELRREMLGGADDFPRVDAYERAVRDLVAAGLLREDGDSIVPTRAALRFAALHA